MACSVKDFHHLTYYHNYRETSDVPVAGSHGFWWISVSWKSWQMVTYCNQPKACSYVFSGRMLTRHIWQLMSNNAKHSRWKFLLQLSAVIVSIKLYVYKTSVLFCFYSINAQCRSFFFFPYFNTDVLWRISSTNDQGLLLLYDGNCKLMMSCLVGPVINALAFHYCGLSLIPNIDIWDVK